MDKSLRNILWTIHITLAVLWVYQGLIPKVLYKAQDEQYIWQQQGFDEVMSLILMQFSGYIEIIFGLLFLFPPFYLSLFFLMLKQNYFPTKLILMKMKLKF